MTLHVSVGTFVPVKTDNIKKHIMHSETFEINQETVDKINQGETDIFRIIDITEKLLLSYFNADRINIATSLPGTPWRVLKQTVIFPKQCGAKNRGNLN